ncbi:hypothetical protein [Nonomuraea angiospora]
MARRHTLTRIAITGTALLWAGTIALSVTDLGSDRLHLTLLTGSFLAAVITLMLLAFVVVDARIRNAVLTSADELHTAVEALRQDRQAIVAMRALTAELVAARAQQQRQAA